MDFPHPVIDKVTLTVLNLERMVDFYKNTFGFQVPELTDRNALLTADGKKALLKLEQLTDGVSRDPHTTGLYHIAFLLPDRSDLADVLTYLVHSRYPLQGASDHDVSEALYLADPEGNGIEIYTDRSADLWKWQDNQVFMTTKPLDIEDLLKAASQSGWKGIPSHTVIGHIHLQVSDLADSNEFYCRGLGFDPVLNYGSQALFVSRHKYHHHIGLNTWQSGGAKPPKENSAGLKEFTILFPSDSERSKVVGQLENIHAWISEDQGTIKTKDPSGIYMNLEVKGKGENQHD